MATKIFINLHLKDVERSKSFFTGLGFSYNSQFTDEKACCLVIGENIFAILLDENYFKTFTRKEISDAKTATEVLIAIDAASKEEARQTIKKAKEPGAEIYAEPQEHGWMYQHSFADPDGHQWEIMSMDQSQLPNQE